MAKSVKNATAEERKQWVEKAKRTRRQKLAEKQKRMVELAGMSNDDVEKYVSKLQFALRALQVNKLSKKDAKAICDVIFTLEEI